MNSQTINNFFSRLPQWPIEEMTGYKPCTTYWQDFSIADHFVINGIEPDGVQDTHNRAWPALKDGFMGIKYLTEYAMVLNWKIHQHYNQHNQLAELYDRLWREVNGWCVENLKGDDLSYYLSTTD